MASQSSFNLLKVNGYPRRVPKQLQYEVAVFSKLKAHLHK
jgi:hypothetical protein